MTSRAFHNYTIDDSQWATAPLHLSVGWNMLRNGGSDEYIKPTQVEAMRPLVEQFWNRSISWTTTENASTTLTFTGTDIWAYGIRGPLQGSYDVTLDNQTVGSYSAHAPEQDLHYLLFEAHALSENKQHYMTLRNTQEGASLAFDYARISFSPASPAPSAPAENASLPTGTAAAHSPYTSAQLASLLAPYDFHWNAPAYFVLAFAWFLGLVGLLCLVWAFRTTCIDVCRRQAATKAANADAESNLVPRQGPRRQRPTTKVLSALRGKRIGSPMFAEDANEAHSHTLSEESLKSDLDSHQRGRAL